MDHFEDLLNRPGRCFIKIVIVSMSLLFQLQNLIEIVSPVIISKYRCIKPLKINFTGNNYNRPI